MTDRSAEWGPAELAAALGLPKPTDEQAAVICAPPGPMVVVAGAGAGKTETMAARVVWLVANGYADPGQVLGLTFTRKAAGQLLRRVRSRLARLAGHLGTESVGAPTVSTYHAFAGALLREFGPLLPVEPEARLLSETERWQLALDVVNSHPDPLAIEANPVRVAEMVLRLSDELAEHLVDTAELRHTHHELERLVHTLPAGPRQRGGPNQRLLGMLDTQTDRAALVPLIDALHARMRQAKVMDFGSQMSSAARLASVCPQVGEQLRERYRVVLLDEYQDTGHAQRVALSALFGGGVDDTLALTAVGDPIQSIYGWRGASATNLPRFTTDFPQPDQTPAPTLELRTSWRNPPRVLQLANAVSAEARRRSVAVRPLLARPDAPAGTVLCALHDDVETEREWVADQLAARYAAAASAGEPPPTAAVLVRRNADAGPVAAALAARGLPVDVVGLAGLLSIPEVAQVISVLRLVADPSAGSAAMEVLTGPRWRLGVRDLAALWRRAVALEGRRPAAVSARQIVDAFAADADSACLADALADPGPPEAYSAQGYQRIAAVGAELARLRGFLAHPVAVLVAEVRRAIGVDVEVRAARAHGSPCSGAEHLDRFADVVARYAERDGADVAGLLAYLDAAATVENGLAPAEVSVAPGRVQVLTVHAAKGLEWQIVAVPHLSARVFPSTAAKRTWLNDPADLPPLLRGDRAGEDDDGGGRHGVPVLDTSAVSDRKALEDLIEGHRRQLLARSIDEERRLLYVALTRAEDTLLISGHHWGATDSTPRGPSDFLCEIKDVIEETGCGEIGHWEPAPADGEPNPLQDRVSEVLWPIDPLGGRRGDVERGAALVAAAMTGRPSQPADDDPHGWISDVDALLAERARAAEPAAAVLPAQLSVSALVDLDRDRTAALRRLARRLPARPDPQAILGTAFHEWVQRFYGAERLFDLDDLPGAGDPQTADAGQLAALQDAFTGSAWAARTPLDVEVPFELVLGGTVVRGRIDAVFPDADGGVTVVDWKTGEPPADEESRRHVAVQLAVYRLAWAGLSNRPVSSVRAAFHYVRTGQTIEPEQLYSAERLAELLTPDELALTPDELALTPDELALTPDELALTPDELALSPAAERCAGPPAPW